MKDNIKVIYDNNMFFYNNTAIVNWVDDTLVKW